MSKALPIPDVTTPAELAEKLGWSERRVRDNGMKSGKNSSMFSPEDIEAMMKAAAGTGDKERAPETVIYFIESRGFIKIGWTQNWRNRISNLQSASPEPITVLALLARPQIYERTMHKKFAAFRVRGEWFVDCKEIREHLAGLSDELLLP